MNGFCCNSKDHVGKRRAVISTTGLRMVVCAESSSESEAGVPIKGDLGVKKRGHTSRIHCLERVVAPIDPAQKAKHIADAGLCWRPAMIR